MMNEFAPPRAAYVHVPFCLHRCGYCDFTLVANRDDLIPVYLNALEIELSSISGQPEIETLFLGGGTPTHLPPRDLQRLMELLRERFTLVPGYEFSVEGNPAGLTAEKVDVLAAAGVNRVSLGVQSFDQAILKTLERDHRETEIHQAVELLRPRIPNISLDLIFGVPGQSLDLWRETLQRALGLQPRHLSTYGLTIEKGTAFWSRRNRGELITLPEELEREMYALSMDTLAAAGFEQYEISNFALPGYACRHNQVYWRAESYYAFGPGAARYLNGRREINHRSVTTWAKRIQSGESPVGEWEELTPEERAHERMVLKLRMVEGLNLQEFQQQTRFDAQELARAPISLYCREGLMQIHEGWLRLTREGRFVADSIIVDLL